MAKILLTGATGNVTGATIKALKSAGHELIALARDPAKAKDLGIEVRAGDLDRPRSLEGAFAGVDTAWVLTPPGPLAPFQSSNALWAARQAGVKHVVRMSAIGAAHDAPTLNGRMHALSDAELAGSGIAFTILKPHFFMQNLMMAAKSIAEQGAMYWALADAKLPMIDVADIGACAAKVLADPSKHAGKAYTLTGPAAVSMTDVAKVLSDALGKPVQYTAVPVSVAVENLTKMGLPDFTQVMMRDYFTAYSGGWQSALSGDVERITGRAPRSIADFVRDAAGAFGKR